MQSDSPLLEKVTGFWRILAKKDERVVDEWPSQSVGILRTIGMIPRGIEKYKSLLAVDSNHSSKAVPSPRVLSWFYQETFTLQIYENILNKTKDHGKRTGDTKKVSKPNTGSDK